MKNLFYISLSALFFMVSVVSCKEKTEVDPAGSTGAITFEYDNVVGNRDLKLLTDNYTNATGESFNISSFNYYISNIKLLKADGSSYVVPKDSSYFLVREADEASQEITLNNVPVGDYTGLEFVVGVDSLKSISDPSERKGVLDQENTEGMYWAWNSGYIFLKLEGSSTVSTSSNGKFYYHIGGYGGFQTKTINNLKTVKVDFGGKKASITKSLKPKVHLVVDALKIFDGSTTLSIAANSMVMFNQFSVNISNNYATMFSLDHIHAH